MPVLAVEAGVDRIDRAALPFSFALRAGGVFVPYVVSHYWRRATPGASLAAIATGSIVVVLAERGLLTFFDFDAAVPGILASALAYAAVSGLSGRAAGGVERHRAPHRRK